MFFALQKKLGQRRPGGPRKPGTPTTPTAFGKRLSAYFCSCLFAKCNSVRDGCVCPSLLPVSIGWQRQLSSAALVRKARKISSDSSRSTAAANPFHRAPSSRLHPSSFIPAKDGSGMTGVPATTSSQTGPNASTNNPFFAQLAKKEKPTPTPFGKHFTSTDDVTSVPPPPYQPTSSLGLPPSYASVVTGKRVSQGSIPSFITHGPGSIPLAAKPEESNEIKNLKIFNFVS